MNDKQLAEVWFWQDLYGKLGKEQFEERRNNDYKQKTAKFKGLHQEIDIGLDLGCGMLSIFEYSPLRNYCYIWAVDPLLDEYRKIMPFWDFADDYGGIYYLVDDGEHLSFPDDLFGWVCCINTLDHTPNPEKMLAEIQRVLKPTGRLYLQVNFDPELYDAHYFLLNWDKFHELLDTTTLIPMYGEFETSSELDGQQVYTTIYRKESTWNIKSLS